MQHSHITEEDESGSISLNEHTLIQIYDNLDYSDEEQSHSSQDDHSLSLSRRKQLLNISQQQRIRHSQPHHSHLGHARHQNLEYREQNRHYSNLENKYQMGVSPSTKEEYSILKSNEHGLSKNYQIMSNCGPDLSKVGSGINEQIEGYKPKAILLEDEDAYQSIQSGRQAQLRKKKEKSGFNIDSFLNADPVCPKGKKGIQVLNKKTNKNAREKSNQQKYNQASQRVINEESLTLITLPELQAERSQKVMTAIARAEKQVSGVREEWQLRFKQARLTFMDTFMPESLKIKSNPYNMLRYINNRIKI